MNNDFVSPPSSTILSSTVISNKSHNLQFMEASNDNDLSSKSPHRQRLTSNIDFDKHSVFNNQDYTVIIRPRMHNECNSSYIRRRINEFVSCKDLHIRIRKTYSTYRHHLAIKLFSQEDANLLIEFISHHSVLSTEFLVFQPKTRFKKILITGVPNYMTESDLRTLFTSELHADFASLTFCNISKSHKIFTTWSLLVQLNVADLLLQKRFMHYNLALIRFKPFVRIIRCYHCQGYGHTSASCKNSTICANCAQAHATDMCESTHVQCINCLHENVGETYVSHSTCSFSCFIYRKLLTYGQALPRFNRD